MNKAKVVELSQDEYQSKRQFWRGMRQNTQPLPIFDQEIVQAYAQEPALPIAQLAKAVKLPKSTLRHWTQEGLLPVIKVNGKHFYPFFVALTVKEINHWRVLGTSLEEIRNHLSNRTQALMPLSNELETGDVIPQDIAKIAGSIVMELEHNLNQKLRQRLEAQKSEIEHKLKTLKDREQQQFPLTQ